MKKYLLGATALLMAFTSFSQEWKRRMMDPHSNFYDTQKAFYKENKKQLKELAKSRKAPVSKREKEQEIPGFELFKRWEHFMEPRVYPGGDVTQASRAWEEYQKYKTHNHSVTPHPMSTTWLATGPFGDPTGSNAGRVNVVRFDPSVSAGLWAGAPDGGLWSSNNSGASWNTNTDALAVIGVSDVVFDPTNSQHMYLATGDGDAGDSYSIGVLESTDGGATWNNTGLSWPVSLGNRIHRLLINPLNHKVLFAGTTQGMMRSTDGGVTWNNVGGGTDNITDMKYRPGDTTVVYGVSSTFYKSTNGGASFSVITTGLPASSAVDRMSIAVTPANSSYVYVVGSDATNDGFYAFYQSTDQGVTFVAKATGSPNLLGWASNGGDTGGQGWYTLSIAASPTNANEVVVGGVNIWRTLNGGSSWSLFAQWTGSGAPYVHADIHDLIYKNGTSVFAGTDGGVFETLNSGTSFTAINGNMNIAEIYQIGLSKTTASLAITGHQDDGTNLYSGGWSNTMGGDGMACFIDWSNDQVMYGEQYQGSFNVTTDGGVNWNGITTGLTGTGAWVTPWHQDPLTANTIYGGYQQLFKSVNQGTSWTQMGTLPGTGSIVEFGVAPSNPMVIYVIQDNKLIKTSDGGTTWTDVTGTLPVGNARLTNLAIKNTDPNKVWVSFSGYSGNDKIYGSTDGGATWTNYSTGLPNLPVNCIASWNGTSGLYIGCDVGVYYRDSTMSFWAPYSNGMPDVSVHDLHIFYPLAKISAATFGRGVWQADLYNNGTQPPVANFTADNTTICAGMAVVFTDMSSFSPNSWSWTFSGGTPATSNQQNPSVTYNTPGTYSVTLTCSNTNGNNSMTKTTYIDVSGVNSLPLSEGFEGALFPPVNWQNYNAGNDAFVWEHFTTTGRASSACMYFNDYVNDATGRNDEMRTPKYDLTAYNKVKLFFDVAYARYDAVYSDSLALLVSTDCGVTYTQVYLKGGTGLATAPDLKTSAFVPTSAQWRTDTVDLTAYAGMGNVMVAFRNIGHNGQNIYVDNINIAGANTHVAPTAQFTHSSALCSGTNIAFTDHSTNLPSSWNWSFTGGVPASSNQQNPTVSYATPGTYTVLLVATNSAGSSTQDTMYITVDALPAVTYMQNPTDICINNPTFPLSAGNPAGGTYSGRGVSGNMFSAVTAGTGTDTITYAYTDLNGCKGMTTQIIHVNLCTGIQTYSSGEAISIYPNPFSDQLTLAFGDIPDRELIQVYDVLGSLVYSTSVSGKTTVLNLGSLDKGIYLVKVTIHGRDVVQKILKM
jgi:PKD repeat protein